MGAGRSFDVSFAEQVVHTICLTELPDSIINLTKLNYLGAGGNPVGDEIVGMLEKMSWLRWLDITNTDLSENAIKHLFDTLPNCEIYSGKRR